MSQSEDVDARLLQSAQLWMDRLQLLTVVTTFFASTDGLLLSIVGAYHHDSNIAENLIHASLAGALAFHVSAAIISFLASFVLVRYKRIVVPETNDSEKPSPVSTNALFSRHLFNQGMFTIQRLYFFDALPLAIQRRIRPSTLPGPPPPTLSDAVTTLIRSSTICVSLSILGLILAVIGILSYVWTWLPRSVSVFTSACLFTSAAAGTYAFY